MALNTQHIDKILTKSHVTNRFYIGTSPSCLVEIPSRRRTFAFITNTSHHMDPGSHWNGWFVRNKTLYFIDSFGRSPLHISFPHEIRDILLKFKNVKYFKKQIQSFDSFCCGYFCIHFIFLFSLGLDFKNFASEYLDNTNENDITVIRNIKSII